MAVRNIPLDEKNFSDQIFGKGGFILGFERFNLNDHGYSMEKFMGWGTMLDCRGKLRIASTARLGWQVMIMTASHTYNKDGIGRRLLRTVLIDDYAWVTSRSILYNCHVEEHAIVGIGSVVKNVVVPAWSIVEGNPAIVVGKYNKELDRYVKFKDGHIEEMEKF